MNNDSLDRLEMTMRRCDNNMKEIYRRKKKFIDKRTKMMVNDILDEYFNMINNFGLDKKIFKVTRRITIDTVEDSKSIMNIFKQYIDFELLKEYCDVLGIIMNVRHTENELFIDFILDKELYENGVYDFDYNTNNSETYIDDFNMSFRKQQ